MSHGPVSNVAVMQGPVIFRLLACVDNALLLARDALCVLNLLLDVQHCFAGKRSDDVLFSG